MEVFEGLEDEELALLVREPAPGSSPLEAFGVLWERRKDEIRRQAERLRTMAPRGASKDLFVEAVVDRVQDNLRNGLKNYEGRGPLKSYIRTTVRRAAIDEYWHLRSRRPEKEARPGARPDGPATLDELLDALKDPPRSSFPTPDRVAEARDRADKVRLALERLAGGPGTEGVPGLHLALVLRRRYFEQKSIADIASEFGIVDRTVYRWLVSAGEQLRQLLKDMFRVESGKDL